MKKFLLVAFGIGVAIAVERRADKLGISPKAVLLGAFQDWLNRASGRTRPVPAETAEA